MTIFYLLIGGLVSGYLGIKIFRSVMVSTSEAWELVGGLISLVTILASLGMFASAVIQVMT